MAVTRVKSRDLQDATIGNADIAADAGIAAGKLAVPQANLIVGDADGKGSAVAMSGDATIAASGAVAIANFAQGQDGFVPGPDAGAVSSNHVLRADGAWVANGGSTFAENEAPQGTGQADQFTLANAPAGNSLRLFKNGIRQMPGSGADYTLSGGTITFEADNVPQSGDVLLADYRY